MVVNEIFWNALAKHADIVLPVTTRFERDDLACTPRDDHLVAMHRLVDPVGEARDDYAILAGIAERLGVGRGVHRGPERRGLAALALHRGPAAGGGARHRHAGVRRVLGRGRVPPAAADRPRDPDGGLPRRPGGRRAADPLGQDRDLLRDHRLVRLRRLPRPPGLARAGGVARLAAGGALPLAPVVQPAGRQAAQPVRPRAATARRPGSAAGRCCASTPTTRRRAASGRATSCGCSTTAAPAWPRRR